MQLQEPFGYIPLSRLHLLGLGIYALIPGFKHRCPLCGRAGCAVRHGLYYRQVEDLDGTRIERFPIPRFRCRRRGLERCAEGGGDDGRTFSVLPLALVPRRRLSLALMLGILALLGLGLPVPRALDRLAATARGSGDALLLEEAMVYRVIALFARAYRRLRKLSAPSGMEPRSVPGAPRDQALALASILGGREPPTLVAEFHHRYFPHLLLKI